MKNTTDKIAIAVILMVILLFLILVSQIIGFNSYGIGSMMPGMYFYGFMGIFGNMFMILSVIVLVLLILWLVKKLGDNKK